MPLDPQVFVRVPGHAAWLARRELAILKEHRELDPVLARVRPYTMVPEDALICLARLVRGVLAGDIPGDFVECGVWRGGASFLMAELLRRAGAQDRKVWLFDSFEGLPPPDPVDGEVAVRYATDKDDPGFRDNCRASVDEVRRTANDLGLSQFTECVKGWFEQTLPVHRQRIGPIALLRIDCDWYASVRCCLDQLFDQVADGGVVVVDDYYAWDGCAIAVHEFLGERRLPHRLETDAPNSMWIRKVRRNDGTEWDSGSLLAPNAFRIRKG